MLNGWPDLVVISHPMIYDELAFSRGRSPLTFWWTSGAVGLMRKTPLRRSVERRLVEDEARRALENVARALLGRCRLMR